MIELGAIDAELLAFVHEAKARPEVHDCLLRYARRIDRHAKALMLSAYHSDALDEHGVDTAEAEAFCDRVIGWHPPILRPNRLPRCI